MALPPPGPLIESLGYLKFGPLENIKKMYVIIFPRCRLYLGLPPPPVTSTEKRGVTEEDLVDLEKKPLDRNRDDEPVVSADLKKPLLDDDIIKA